VSVLQVGHNGSTGELLAAVTPAVAVIPVEPSAGQDPNGFGAFVYGHPRASIVDLLAGSIMRIARLPNGQGGDGTEKNPEPTVDKAVYATGWDGTVRVAARATGALTVFR